MLQIFKLKLSVLFLFLLTTCLVSPDLSELRKNYPKANDEEAIAKEMYEALSKVSDGDKTILIAYKGGISTIMAKHAKGIKDKKNFFKEGVALLENAVKQNPDNIEIRCIRMGVQENSPKFLKYKGQIETDKKVILEKYPSESSQEVKDFVKGYVLQSEAFSPEEKRLF